MTFKDLLLHVSFDDVLAHIGDIDKKQLDMAAQYKQVFDRLRQTPDSQNEGKITVAFEQPEKVEGFPEEEPYLAVEGIHEVSDSESLGRQIVYDKTLSLEEVAACCLWEYTFYGFDKEDIDEFFGYRPSPTRYGLLSTALQKRYYGRLLHYSKWQKENNRSKRFQVAYTLEEWNIIHRIENHGNRSKRKRAFRIEQRVERLEKLDKTERLIQLLTDTTYGTATLQREELAYLFKAKTIRALKYHSYTDNPANRAAYIHELIMKYVREAFYGYDRYVICFITSPNYPLTTQEKEEIGEVLPSGPEVLNGFRQDYREGPEIGLRLIMSRGIR